MSNSDFARNLRIRTKNFALEIIRQTEDLPVNLTSEILRKQIIRSATSVGANYRSACRSRSKPDFIAKLRIVLEETDETLYWLELLDALRLLSHDKYYEIHGEGEQLVAIFVTSLQTAKRSQNQ